MKRIIVLITCLILAPITVVQAQVVIFEDFVIPIGEVVQLSTLASSNVTNTSAALELSLDKGPDDTFVWFAFDTSNQVACENPDRAAFAGRINRGQTFKATITGLTTDTGYFYRACAQRRSGSIVSGDVNQFQTTNTISIMTNRPDDVDQTSATLKAELMAGVNVRIWFAVSSPNGSQPGCGSAPSGAAVRSIGSNNTAIVVTQSVQGLMPGARYRYRACAQNTAGGTVVQSNSIAFTTGDATTEVLTGSATNIGPNSVTLNGTVVSGTDVDAFFVLADRSTATSCDSAQALVDLVPNLNTGDAVTITYDQTNDVFTSNDLLSNTQYFYRLCGRGSGDNDDSGDLESFVTNGDGDAIEFTGPTERTDTSLTVAGKLVRDGQAKNTWFFLANGRISIDDDDCRTRNRSSEEVLTSLSDSNEHTFTGLDDNRTYTIGFCGEGATAGTGQISLGGQRVINTKRNSSTRVVAACGATFSSKDGPLTDVTVTQASGSGLFRNDSSTVVLSNFGRSNNVDWRVTQSLFGASERDTRRVAPRTKRTLPILVGDQPNPTYGITISASSNNWEVELNCRNADCVIDGKFVQCGARFDPIP